MENFSWEAFECSVKVGDAVLREETDKVKSLERVLARRGW
jgi:hypothetical protein